MTRHLSVMSVLVLALLTGCGGGGGTGVGKTISYVGKTTQAVLSDANVERLTELALDRAEDISSSMPDPTADSVPRGAARPLVKLSRALAKTENWVEVGDCGGKMTISAELNENTGDFSASMEAAGFCSEGMTMDGAMTMSGQVSGTGMLLWFKADFSLLSLKDSSMDVTMAGTISEEFRVEEQVTRMSATLAENVSKRTYLYKDYVFTSRPLSGGVAESVSGRFYEPDQGYVDVSTVEPLFFPFGRATPSSGSIEVSGAGGGKSRWKALSDAAFSITADFDGDLAFDDFSTGVVHYEGMNNQPAVSAGEERFGDVGCGPIAITSASASDADTDPLDIAWTFASKPAGSTAPINSATTLAPSFVPDLAGTYVMSLTVSDGIGTPVASTVRVDVYGDLFCLASTRLIPAAANSMPASILVGDVTGDGRPDVVMATTTFNTLLSDPAQDYHLYVFAQDGNGDLAAPVSYPGVDGKSLALADVNGDGLTDVVASTQSGVGIYHQTAQGGLLSAHLLPFGETMGVYGANEVVAADFTGDGLADVASAYSTFTEGKVRLWVQGAGGVFSDPALFTLESAYWKAQAADVDGVDGPDLLLTSGSLGQGSITFGVYARVLKRSGNTLAPPVGYVSDHITQPLSTCGGSMAVGDFIGDAGLDLAASCLVGTADPEPELRVYPLVEGGSAPASAFQTPGRHESLLAADLSQDGKAELIGFRAGNEIAFDVYRGGGPLSALETYPLRRPDYNYSMNGFAVGDVNGDGAMDAVTAVFVGPEGGTGVLFVPGNPNRSH